MMRVRRRRILPGPRPLPFIGSPWAITGDPLAKLSRLQRQYGDLTAFWIGRQHVVVVADPDRIEDILVKRRTATIKDPVTRELSSVLGNGLVTSDGAHWKRQRKAIAPSFTPRQLASYAEAMVRSADECLPPVGPRDVHEDMSRTTLHIVIRTIFGAEPSGEAGEVGPLVERMMEAFVTEQRTAWRFVPKVVPGRHRREVAQARQALDALIYRLIDRARTSEGSDALLHRLIAACDDQGMGMTDEELRDELLTLFLAGHETTSLLLSFTLWMLAEHPEVQERLHDELDRVLGSDVPGPDILRQLPFMDAVLDETLRLYPPVWAIARELVEPLDLGPATLEVGAKVVISMWMLHRDPRFWIGPERFRPDRWRNGETDDLHRMAFLPFSDGARVCVGNHFAKMEAGIVLARVLQQRGVAPVPGYAPDFVASVTLRPRNGVHVRLVDRG
jgi:cytochrome P450